MKQIKQAILIFVMLLSSQFAKAQMSIDGVKNGNYGTPEQRAGELTQAMMRLNLNEYQLSKVKEINLRYAYRAENEVIKQNLSTWSKYWKLNNIQADKDKELKYVLNKEQFELYVKKKNQVIAEGFKSFFF